MASREQLHTQCARSLQEKDELRKRVRELSEKADELQLQLFQCESRLLAAEGRLKQQQLDTLTLVGCGPGWPASSALWSGLESGQGGSWTQGRLAPGGRASQGSPSPGLASPRPSCGAVRAAHTAQGPGSTWDTGCD